MFSTHETQACRALITLALDEDFGPGGDQTSQVLIPAQAQGVAAFVARNPGILAGMPAVEMVLAAVDPRLVLKKKTTEGGRLEKSDLIARVQGPLGAILAAERTALNFLQHLSGIATLTRRFVDAVAGLPCKILDTRKTLPAWRLLEKYATRCGGGHNHRLGLYDGILIKDNHLAGLGTGPGVIKLAVEKARKASANKLPLEIEVENLEQLDEALACRPNIILLDNMNLNLLREAVQRRKVHAPQVLLEASGGVTLETVRAIAETGVDRISVGALTHSAPALDIALDYLRE